MTVISLPKLSLVLLIGPSGSGKSTFARRHFLPTEILSSDAFRGMVCDDENSQSATSDAFDALHFVASKRLALGRLTVIDATNVQPEVRKSYVAMARQYHCLPVAIVLDLPERICHQRNLQRPDRSFGPHVIRNQASQLRRSIKSLKKEGFRNVTTLKTEEQVEAATVERVPLWNDRTDDHGPFDIIGDVHGCCDELEALLDQLGYVPSSPTADSPALIDVPTYAHPEGRKAVFVGDLVDRGPRILDVVRLVAAMVHSGSAFCVPGNHDAKLLRKLWGRNVQVTHGLAATMAEIEALPEEERQPMCEQVAKFLDGLISHYLFDRGKLVVAHAGMKEEMQGRGSGKVREFALYGETTGEIDEFGFPVRLNWASEYRGNAMVVYGHTPVPEPVELNRTINIDTGCVFGGHLTALRYPEHEFVSVPARETYCEPGRPFLSQDQSAPLLNVQQVDDQLLDASDVLGKRIIPTRLYGNITIREENAAAALEVMSRFAVDPRWLIYLPPTMSPCETSHFDGFLEYPNEAFTSYRNEGVPQVICQEKHMGSRAVVIVCKDEQSALDRFGVTEGETGIVTTRTGRRFFNDGDLELKFLDRLRGALTAAEVWTKFGTNWVLLDCELMPWSAKAQGLLRDQYAAVGAAGKAAMPKALKALDLAAGRLLAEEAELTQQVQMTYQRRAENIGRYVEAYQRYCWSVESLTDLKLAPFHLLATEGQLHIDKDHTWHMSTLAEICRQDADLLMSTAFSLVDVTDEQSLAAGTAWWEAMTSQGGEGMVVKPISFWHRARRRLSQPAVKCRGREYLRIIYGPDYTNEENLSRLRNRSLGRKRSLALREFALGIEALERFVRREPLRRVHEAVFGVLALGSEPVDPRL